MRIIAGEAKRRKLKSINGTPTRPTLDRVKESIFNILGSAVIDSKGLDLFAGFGGLGLEAVSRGAKHFTFIEKNRRNAGIIQENIKLCNFEDRSIVIVKDVFSFLRNYNERYDLILMDPPYGKDLGLLAIELINSNNLLTEEGIIVLEHGKDDQLIFQNPIHFGKVHEKNYGDTVVTIFQKKGE